MLQTIIDRSEANNSVKASPKTYIALLDISRIYLTWNRRNDKKVIKMLEDMKLDFEDIFVDKPNRHLHLLEG